MRPNIAYKILTAEEMSRFETEANFAGSPADLRDGFLHLSTAAQLPGTLAAHFAGQDGLWLAAVDIEAMGDAVRWKRSRGGEHFPHLHAELPLSAVVAYGPIEYEPNGTLKLPVSG